MMSKLNGVIVILSLTALPVVAACGGGAPADEEQAGTEDAQAEAGPAVDPAVAATITGVVNFEGTAPEPESIDMDAEPDCAEKHPDGASTQEVVVNDDGTLANVFVHVREGLGDREFPASSDPVVLDQDGCVYHPHVFGIQVGQTLTIRNSDGLLHNINARPEENRPFNISQPVDMDTERSFAVPEVMIPIQCDVHGWMQAYVGVVDHPYHAVSGDDGSFTLENLPPGEYVVEAWHERYGVQTANVTVGEQETEEIEFTYDAGMAQNADVPLGDPIDLHDDHGGDDPRITAVEDADGDG
ncbi:MAG: carboxypeptidase regulatory-like domain-containing protein [Gemmatimonadota bacterium]